MNVFIVDDSSQIRKDLVDLLADEKRIDVVGQAGSVREALAGLNAVLTEAVILAITSFRVRHLVFVVQLHVVGRPG
jgi:two-component system, NarL family, response regulator DevR